MLSQSPPQSIIMSSTPAPGVYEATESITLLPGFSFTASSGNSLTLRIAPAASSRGGIIAYATGHRFNFDNNPLDSFPSNAQLQRLTHVIAMGIGNIFEFSKINNIK